MHTNSHTFKAHLRLAVRLLLPCILIADLCGCASYWTRKELEGVARDWCQVVRASQVIPIYPLSEDVRPGDIFLVTKPIGQEASLFSRDAFLPLDQHYGRLQGLDFQTFYAKSFGIGEHTNTPTHWQFPDALAAAASSPPETNAPVHHRAPTDWANAPRAAFPTYNFKVKSGGGLKLALPIQGVPLGLNFLQAGTASGTLTIVDSYVYGLSHTELTEKLSCWANDKDRKATFCAMRQNAARPLYLRVVNRVYLTGSVVVALHSERTTGAELSGGQSQEVSMLERGDETTAQNYAAMLALLNKRLEESLPGGSVKFVQASGRAVSMKEVFDRPLVIGYLAFDFPILKDGSLGAPVSTLERLNHKTAPEVQLGTLSPQQIDYSILVAAVASRTPSTQASIYEEAAANAGKEFNQLYLKECQSNEEPTRAFAKARNQWMTQRAQAEELLTRALRTAWENNLGNR